MAILIIWAPPSLASLHMAIPLFAACRSRETSSLVCPVLVAQLAIVAPFWAEPCQLVVVLVSLLVDHMCFIAGNCHAMSDSSLV